MSKEVSLVEKESFAEKIQQKAKSIQEVLAGALDTKLFLDAKCISKEKATEILNGRWVRLDDVLRLVGEKADKIQKKIKELEKERKKRHYGIGEGYVIHGKIDAYKEVLALIGKSEEEQQK